tara:strand:+ start:3824 stop:5353 length:1530 start_codon:yes stop_codon:yes gene_type:complete
MSGFYDDGGVGFAKEQFDNARKRRDKQAKKQDKFSQKLLLADLAVKGFNMSLNNKAQKLEQEALFKNSNLFSEVEASTSFLNFYNEEKNKGLDDKAIFRDYVNSDFTRFIDPDNKGYVVDAKDSLVNNYINDETNFNNFKGMIKHHQKIGSLDPEQLTEFIKSGVKAPRNIGELIGNKIKKITMSHTDETLQAKDAQVKSEVIDRLAKLGFNFGDSANTYKGSMSIIEQEIKNNPEKYRPYIRTEFKELVMKPLDGQMVPHLLIKKDYKDGTFVTEAVPIMAGATDIPRTPLTPEELTFNQDLIAGIAMTDMDYMQEVEPGFRNYFKAQFAGVNKESPEFVVQNYKDVISIVDGQKYILDNYKNLITDPIVAMEYSIASMYRNRQRGINASQPSLYDIEMIALEKNPNAEYDDVAGKIESYLKDFEKYGEVERDLLINSMLKELPKMFTEDADRDRANEILERKGRQTLDDIESILEEEEKEKEKENLTSNNFDSFFQYNTKFKENPLG